jgi:hypothetical protein
MHVELTAAREWNERQDCAPRVRGTREQHKVGARAKRLSRPALDGSIVDER